MKNRIYLGCLRAALLIIKFTPFTVLYIISDLMSLLFYRVIHYRRRVVEDQLALSFPDLTDQQRNTIARNFYKNLSDIFVESIKGYTLSSQQISHRWRITNPKLITSYLEQGKSVIIISGHFLNWEWGTCLGYQINHPCISFYKPVHNQLMNDFLNQCRSSPLTELCPAQKASRCFIKNRSKARVYGMIADQHPVDTKEIQWVNFLNQDTATIMGPEQFARAFDYPVLYITGERPKRGFYDAHLTLLSDQPKETQPGEITTQFMKHLESDIIKSPENWLWSHRRWKLKRTETETST